MITAKEAITNAVTYFHDFYPNRTLTYLQAEEVELSEDGKYWLITLGYRTSQSTLETTKYRVFKFDTSGKFRSMKIRKTDGS